MVRPPSTPLSLDPECLEALESFAIDYNLTRAARRLRRAQPTVHAQLRRLADAIGAPLYARVGRALALTAEGTAVLAYARDSRARLESLAASLAQRTTDEQPTLATGEGALLYLLGPALAAFRRKAHRSPKLALGSREQTLAAVRSAAAQIGVTALGAAPPDDLEWRTIATVRTAVVLERTHPLAKKKRLEIQGLAGVALVLPPAPSELRAAIERQLFDRLEVAIEARGWPLAMHCARLGLGAAVVNDFCVPPSGCVSVALTDGPAQRYVVFKRRAAGVSSTVDALWQCIVERSSS